MPNSVLTNRIMQIHLSSWRYLALLTLPPLGVACHFFSSPLCALPLTLFFITHYFCWRLWLDERLFQLIASENHLVDFDEGMSHLWSLKAERKTRTLAERYLGVRRLFRRAIFATTALWVTALILLLLQP